MRKLMWFTLGFGAACGLCVYLLPGEKLLLISVLAFAVSVTIGFAGRRSMILQRAAVTVLGLSLGIGWYAGFYSLYLDSAVALDGQTQTVTVRTSDYSYETAYGIAADGILTIEDKNYQVRVYLDKKQALSPGTVLNGPFRLRITTADGEQEQTSHSGKGIFLLAYQEDEITVQETAPDSLRERASVLRSQIKDILKTCFPSDAYPFVKALLLGDTTDLSYETDTDLKLSGIRHVAAVSGLHVSILFALLMTVTFRRRYLTALVGFPVLLLFAAVAGFTPSVNRACLMSGLMILGTLLDREYDGATSLSFAALVMLVINPMVITSISFQLSVASVAGIFLFGPMLGYKTLGSKNKILRKVFSSISTSLSAMALTTPLCAWYFGTVSLVSVLTNLLTLWVISFIFCGIVGVCLLFLFWQGGAVLLAKLISLPVRYVLLVARILADFPLAAVYTESVYIVTWLIFVYLLLAVFLLSRKKKAVELLCCGCLGLCISLMASWAEPMQEDMRFTVLDVGQGQCLLLQSEGRTFMVDCGGDSDSQTADLAAETLLSQGITKLDGLILTHLDRDHAGGAINFLSRVDTEVLVLPPVETDLEQAAAGEVLYASEDMTLEWGSSALHIFASELPGSGNENSLAILFDTEKCDILITGDRNAFAERMLLRSGDIPDVDVLVAGHHGSKNSTCEELLYAAQPEIVCISAGENNSYGHPAPETLRRLHNFGCTVYRTDQNGTIIIRR